MKVLGHLALFLAGGITLSSCGQSSLPAAPAGSEQQPTATMVSDITEPTAAPTEAPTPTPDYRTRTPDPPTKSPIGLSLSSPATLNTAVELPDMTITLLGTGLPAGFKPFTPHPGQRFVTPSLSVRCSLPPDTYCQTLGSFELIDSQGTRHSAVVAANGQGFLPTGPLPGGTSIGGGLVFMVPIDASPMVLRYVGYQGIEAYFRIE